MLIRLAVAVSVLSAAVATPALAQARAEIAVFGGWTLSDGFEGDAVVAQDGNIYDRIDPKDSGSWGFSVGFFGTENAEFGFIYGRQFSTMLLGGTAEREVGDLAITGYHGYFGYNFGEADRPARPFVFGGLGATHYGSVDFTVGGVSGSTGGETKFSTTWGGGVKFQTAGAFGGRVMARITPTYITTDPGGWWCDPYWGCYVVGNAQYANQIEFAGGVSVRF